MATVRHAHVQKCKAGGSGKAQDVLCADAQAGGQFRGSFKETIWCLRTEAGEVTGRLHLHALIAGFPKRAITTPTCFAFMRIWEGLNGGMARVTLYSPLLDGVGYVLKGCEADCQRAGGDFYETQKFGKRCDVMLSESVFPCWPASSKVERGAARTTPGGVKRSPLYAATALGITAHTAFDFAVGFETSQTERKSCEEGP